MLYQPPFLGDKLYEVTMHGDEPFQIHWHEEIELMYCMKGELSIQVEKEVVTLSSGQAILINSAAPHSYATSSGAVTLVIEVSRRLLGEQFELFLENRYEPKPFVPTENVECLLRRVMSLEQAEQDGAKGWLGRSYLNTLFAELYCTLPHTPATTDKYKRALMRLESIRPAIKFAEQRYRENVDVAQAAAVACYEKTSFCRVFKAVMGITFLQYLTMCRMREAKILLVETDQAVQDIGRQVGISSHGTFCRTFRQYCGMTPSEFRKKSLK